MVKVAIRTLCRSILDLSLRFTCIAGGGQEYGLHTGKRTGCILRMTFQGFVNLGGGLLPSSKLEQSPCRLGPFHRGIESLGSAFEYGQSFVVPGLKEHCFPDAVSCGSVTRVDGHGILRFHLRLVQKTDMDINQSQLMMGLV